MNKCQGQKGFTLIELMIVVAVIGVLSAIAMPQYQKYVAKAEVASVLATLTGVKTNVEAHTVEHGTFPAANTESALGVPGMSLGTVLFVPTAEGDGGAITFTFSTTASASVSTLVSTKNLTLTRTATSGEWKCSSTDINEADSLLPKTCKGKE
ncbi:MULTISPECIES: pilin [Aliivibrio]|uniref:Prepilin-type N-terminal cleavage/methylation domain-containing protein n=1 Tax=Aliivibrio logei 5S-186 TaxID=626086 RepID=A0ABX3ASU0_ALILO|nr:MULTISPECIES: pilin [Aliivibrio]MBB1312171.1 pilin [Aliivibrio sp. SR45-2]OEF11366.1 prepilin-type N-terminal cleavage/methylation domain-containing protein [Aliivibrio logei 5S-186]